MTPHVLHDDLVALIAKVKSDPSWDEARKKGLQPRWFTVVEDLERIRERVQSEKQQADAWAAEERVPYYGG